MLPLLGVLQEDQATQNCHIRAEDLGQSHAGSQVVGSVFEFCEPSFVDFLSFLGVSLIPLALTTLSPCLLQDSLSSA